MRDISSGRRSPILRAAVGFLALVAVVGTPAPASEPRTDLATALEAIRAKHQLPAMACAIVRGGELSASAATGRRATRSDALVTLDDKWHIGSDAKAMTATLLGMLIDRGKLRWDTTLGEVFPELREAMDPAYRDVTVEQLLWNRGGFPEDLKEGGLWEKLTQRQGTPAEQRRVLLEGVLIRPPAAPPGTKFIYSNAGYATAGAIAERITGQSWEELMREMLFEPLGMESAGFGAPGAPPVASRPASSAPACASSAPASAPQVGDAVSAADAPSFEQPWGHAPNLLGYLIPIPPGPLADNPPALAPAGTVHCSVGDWAKFVALHLRGARGELTPADSRLIGADTIRRLQTPPQERDGTDAEYACGWGVLERSWGGRVLTHAGSNTIWFAVVWLAPREDLAVLVATNAGGPAAEKACDEAAGELISRVLSDRRRQNPE